MSSQDDPRDALAALRAKFDQLSAACREFAQSIATYRQALIDAGVPEEPDALQLTIAYQSVLLAGALLQSGDDPT